MREQLRIQCASSSSYLVFTSPGDREGAQEGCEFVAALEGGPVSASVLVWDLASEPWSAFFADLAANWRGWAGEKSLESLEDNLRLTARSDVVGHVILRVVLRDDHGHSDWRAEKTLFLEAGQLERLALQAARVFGLSRR